MTFDFAAAKLRTRQIVHKTLAVSALYSDDAGITNTPITVRWHNKLSVHGDLEREGYAQIIEGIDRLIFNSDELAAIPLTLARGGVVTIPQYQGAQFQLDTSAPTDGPLDLIWNVARK